MRPTFHHLIRKHIKVLTELINSVLRCRFTLTFLHFISLYHFRIDKKILSFRVKSYSKSNKQSNIFLFADQYVAPIVMILLQKE